MLAALLPLLAFILLAYGPSSTSANHFTCTWGGPGNDPHSAGWLKSGQGVKERDDGATALYTVYHDSGGHARVADIGKLRPPTRDGSILEFHTPCNGGGWALPDWCRDPHFYGLCLGNGPPYSKCLYMQQYDDCEWPDLFKANNHPSSVFMFRIRHDLWNAQLEARARNSTVPEGDSDHYGASALQLSHSANATGGISSNVEKFSSEGIVTRKPSTVTAEGAATRVGKARSEDANKRVFTTKARSLGSKDVTGSHELEAFGEGPKPSSEQATVQHERANQPKSATIWPKHTHAASEHEVKVGASGMNGAPVVAARSPWAREANPSGVTREEHRLGDGQVEGTEGEGP